MIMTRMSHRFFLTAHANCVGAISSSRWRHHDVFVQIESRVWQIYKYLTLAAVYLDTL